MRTTSSLLILVLSATSACGGNSASTRADRDRGLPDAPVRGDLETEPMVGDLAVGIAAWRDEETAEAEAALNRHLKKNPRSSLAWYYAGLCAMEKRGTDKTAVVAARKAFQKAADLNPQLHGALSNLGVLFLEAGEDIAALKVLQQARETSPDDPRILANLGVAYLRRGLWTEAVESYKLAVKVAPGHGTLQYDLGVAYAMRHEWALALEAAEQALLVRPRFALAHALRVAALQGLGKLQDARAVGTSALDECDPLADNHLVLARALMALGAADDAQEQLELAIKVDADNANVQLAAGEFADARGKREQAIKWYEAFLKNKKPLLEDTRRIRERLRILKEPAGES